MAGKNNTAGHGAGRGGAGRGSGGRGQSYAANKISTKKVGLCKDLEGNIFDYGTETAANLMRTTQEKLIQYVETKFGGDIANELQHRTTVVIPPPTYSIAVMARHAARKTLVRGQQNNLLAANQAKKAIIKMRITSNPSNLDLPIELAELENKISQLNYDIAQDVEIHLAEHKKNEYCLESKTHTDQTNKLVTHHEQVYALIVGQCTQLLLDKLKQDPTWSAVSKSNDPLALYAIIERVILKQTDDQYPFAAIHKQVLAVHSTKQGSLTNAQWYKHFNTCYEVARSIGVEFDNVTLLWEYCAG
jgi:hypothetical protein